jgi:hypothetical protein
MITVKAIYNSLLVTLVFLEGISCKGTQRNTTGETDTTILAISKQSFTIETDSPFYQAVLLSPGKKLSAGKKVFLLLDHPAVIKNPDGVYEVYITREATDVKAFSSSQPAFVNLLDLYSLTAANPPAYISIDLTKNLTGLLKTGESLPAITITILFRGNLLPDNTGSKQAGQLKIKGMRMVEE